jgi:tetrapyrrole methylase family protein/MazG family protein
MLGGGPTIPDAPAAPAEPPAVLMLAGRNGPGGDRALSVLRRLYPDDHPVGRPGQPDGTLLAGVSEADLSDPLYLPPLPAELAAAGPWAMPYIAERLRRPDGCPWDREQTHHSLRKYLLEETYEVYDALEAGSTPDLAEELGDLLLQVILHAQLAAEAGVFDLADVQASITRKIVRRHPHVFGEAEARTAADVNRQWERIKAQERAEAGAAESGAPESRAPVRSALDGISRSMPALAASQEMQERAAALGYDWPTIEGILEKVAEELDELAHAADEAQRQEEFGDLLLVIVNVGRRMGIDTETALRAASDKFRRRFASVERQAADRGVALRDLSFEELDSLWDAAKAEERGS